MFWARASDRWGRKPVLVLSLIGAFIATTAFGFSTHVWQMYLARFVAGVFGGNAMVLRTMFAESCDHSNQALA
jgi:MFS family permease